LTKTDNTRLP